MTVKQAEDLCARLTYTPGSKISCGLSLLSDALEVRIMKMVPDVITKNPVAQQSLQIFPLERLKVMDSAHFLEMVYMTVQALEEHEIKEWFRLDKIPFKDPHPELL